MFPGAEYGKELDKSPLVLWSTRRFGGEVVSQCSWAECRSPVLQICLFVRSRGVSVGAHLPSANMKIGSQRACIKTPSRKERGRQ